MSDALDELVRLLDLERIEADLFRGVSPKLTGQRVFGGQVAGQALVAAGRTVPPDRPVHSLHAYFLRPGDPSVPIVYEVDRIRDGRSYTTRRVVAVQHGRAIFHLSASFTVPDDDVSHQLDMPSVPAAESLPTSQQRLAPRLAEMPEHVRGPRPIDLRYVDDPPMLSREPVRPPRSRVWMRADGRLPDDPLLHVCALTYASDMCLLDSILIAHGKNWLDDIVSGASLDHAMWFHRPFRADEWMLYDQDSPAAHGARGLARGEIFSQDGTLVVSVVQEGMIHTRR